MGSPLGVPLGPAHRLATWRNLYDPTSCRMAQEVCATEAGPEAIASVRDKTMASACECLRFVQCRDACRLTSSRLLQAAARGEVRCSTALWTYHRYLVLGSSAMWVSRIFSRLTQE